MTPCTNRCREFCLLSINAPKSIFNTVTGLDNEEIILEFENFTGENCFSKGKVSAVGFVTYNIDPGTSVFNSSDT